MKKIDISATDLRAATAGDGVCVCMRWLGSVWLALWIRLLFIDFLSKVGDLSILSVSRQ